MRHKKGEENKVINREKVTKMRKQRIEGKHSPHPVGFVGKGKGKLELRGGGCYHQTVEPKRWVGIPAQEKTSITEIPMNKGKKL